MKIKAPIKFFSGRASHYLAEKITKSYGTELGKTSVLEFSDGEFQPYFEESVRGCIVFIVQSTFPPSDNLMELLLLIDAAKRASAYQVVAVMPYLGLARQDRKDRPRCSIGAKLVADILTAAGADRVMTMDLHADQIQGLENLVMAAPDMGGTKRANVYSRFLNCEMVICYKVRKKANVVEEIRVIGDIKDKNIVIVDDMIDTAGTVCLASKLMMEEGARSVRVVCSHPVLSGPAYDRIQNSDLTEVVVTDTIPLRGHCDKIKVLTIADLFADVIHKVYRYKSITENFLI
jgi:ribose-phosphate pyrophosphokinase